MTKYYFLPITANKDLTPDYWDPRSDPRLYDVARRLLVNASNFFSMGNLRVSPQDFSDVVIVATDNSLKQSTRPRAYELDTITK